MFSISIPDVLFEITKRRRTIPSNRAMLVGISGIDASGKGFVANEIAETLSNDGMHTAVISVDGWLNLPRVRFNLDNPGQHFYDHAIRFDQMFSALILPLRRDRSIQLWAYFTEETAIEFQKRAYSYSEVDIILLEGIFLFKRESPGDYDLKIWVECSFSTALKRALTRAQEGLPPAETVKAYEEIYFPAQKIHFRQDHPRENADLIIENDF